MVRVVFFQNFYFHFYFLSKQFKLLPRLLPNIQLDTDGVETTRFMRTLSLASETGRRHKAHQGQQKRKACTRDGERCSGELSFVLVWVLLLFYFFVFFCKAHAKLFNLILCISSFPSRKTKKETVTRCATYRRTINLHNFNVIELGKFSNFIQTFLLFGLYRKFYPGQTN